MRWSEIIEQERYAAHRYLLDALAQVAAEVRLIRAMLAGKDQGPADYRTSLIPYGNLAHPDLNGVPGPQDSKPPTGVRPATDDAQDSKPEADEPEILRGATPEQKARYYRSMASAANHLKAIGFSKETPDAGGGSAPGA